MSICYIVQNKKTGEEILHDIATFESVDHFWAWVKAIYPSDKVVIFGAGKVK